MGQVAQEIDHGRSSLETPILAAVEHVMEHALGTWSWSDRRGGHLPRRM
jgi:hypothetical protein